VRADRDGRREADAIEAVVDDGVEALQRPSLGEQRRRKRQRVEAVRDGAAERPAGGALGVDVDPLTVAGVLGEGVDVLLGDEVPAADARAAELVGEGHANARRPVSAWPRMSVWTSGVPS
jgi:hypothetical protein